MSTLWLFTIVCLIQITLSLKPVGKCPEINHKGQRLYHLVHADCNKFYKCDNGKMFAYKCDEGLYFNTELEVCDYPYKVKCTPKKVVCPKKNYPRLVHLPHDICSKFYKCNFGEPIAMDCPKGQHFLPRQEFCGFPDESKKRDCRNEE